MVEELACRLKGHGFDPDQGHVIPLQAHHLSHWCPLPRKYINFLIKRRRRKLALTCYISNGVLGAVSAASRFIFSAVVQNLPPFYRWEDKSSVSLRSWKQLCWTPVCLAPRPRPFSGHPSSRSSLQALLALVRWFLWSCWEAGLTLLSQTQSVLLFTIPWVFFTFLNCRPSECRVPSASYFMFSGF